MIRPLAAAVAITLAAAAASSAHAAAGAEARILDITYTLVDLDLSDGIAPSFTFVNDAVVNRFRTELTVDVANSDLGTSDNAISADFSFIAPLSLDRAVFGNQASSLSSPTSASAWVLSAAKGHASAFASAESNLLFADDFGLRLTPNTSITISGVATVTAFDAGAAGAEGNPFEFAQAQAFLRIRAGDPGDGSGLQEELSMRTAQTDIDAVADAADDSGMLSVSFANLSATPLFGYLSVRSTASAFGVSPIPEPPAWAFAIAGTAWMVVRFRRRDARARATAVPTR
jgi:hypothetical protein